jgi:hypothetical protein
MGLLVTVGTINESLCHDNPRGWRRDLPTVTFLVFVTTLWYKLVGIVSSVDDGGNSNGRRRDPCEAR